MNQKGPLPRGARPGTPGPAGNSPGQRTRKSSNPNSCTRPFYGFRIPGTLTGGISPPGGSAYFLVPFRAFRLRGTPFSGLPKWALLPPKGFPGSPGVPPWPGLGQKSPPKGLLLPQFPPSPRGKGLTPRGITPWPGGINRHWGTLNRQPPKISPDPRGSPGEKLFPGWVPPRGQGARGSREWVRQLQKFPWEFNRPGKRTLGFSPPKVGYRTEKGARPLIREPLGIQFRRGGGSRRSGWKNPSREPWANFRPALKGKPLPGFSPGVTLPRGPFPSLKVPSWSEKPFKGGPLPPIPLVPFKGSGLGNLRSFVKNGLSLPEGFPAPLGDRTSPSKRGTEICPPGDSPSLPGVYFLAVTNPGTPGVRFPQGDPPGSFKGFSPPWKFWPHALSRSPSSHPRLWFPPREEARPRSGGRLQPPPRVPGPLFKRGSWAFPRGPEPGENPPVAQKVND
ncbi:COL4A [Acanthosepion pharaonis]|uniref:COL4A n=1 Tax=Acanthosepion pharaonis TaxID=158019 RepID=A0A812DGC1_ACAPH|nr:COL4A [Sepia pharaonis]